jgi:3-oxoacyl-[acyl-carrier-protein] synthase II
MTEKSPGERIVITGMGVAAPTENGLSVEGFWGDLLNNRHGIKPITDILEGYTEVIKTKIGAPLAHFDLAAELQQAGFDTDRPNIRSDQRRWHRSAQAVVWTGSMALRQAGLLKDNTLEIDPDQIDPARFGIYEGTGVGGALTMVDIQKKLDELVAALGTEEKAARIIPIDMLHLLPGRVDEAATLLFNAKAFNDTMLTECAAGLSSIGHAMDEMRLGRADVVLAGGVETAAHPVTIAAFESMKALNMSKASEADQNPRPLSTNPGGLVLGEGAAQVVLETLEHARWRQEKLGSKVVILAEVLGTGKSSDAEHETRPSKDGAGRATADALRDANLESDQIDNMYINGHLTATDGDANEFISDASIFRPSQVVGYSTIKSHTGHTFGAAGALGTVTGVKALATGWMPANRNLNDPLPETAGWEVIPNDAKQAERIEYAKINAFGFGGKNRVAFLGKPPQER